MDTELVPADDLPITAAAAQEIRALAARAAAARGVLMKVIGYAGSQVENRLEALPDAAKVAIESATSRALELAYQSAEAVGRDGQVPDIGRRGHALAAALTGAAGGFGGFASALVEIPVTVAIMFAAIQQAARAEGFDPGDEAVRRECLMIFAAGDPTDPTDEGMNTSFLMSRVTISGASLHRLIAAVAPRLAGLLTQKLAAQTV
ncbi:MAG: EcsC family protein, partial [Albidovulum sp.]